MIFFPSRRLCTHITVVETMVSCERAMNRDSLTCHQSSERKLADTGDRTSDLLFSSPVLYQISYEARHDKVGLVIFVYLPSLPVAHLSEAPEDGQLLRGIVQGYSTKLTRILPSSLTCSAYSTVTRDIGNVSSERLLVNFLVGQPA